MFTALRPILLLNSTIMAYNAIFPNFARRSNAFIKRYTRELNNVSDRCITL